MMMLMLQLVYWSDKDAKFDAAPNTSVDANAANDDADADADAYSEAADADSDAFDFMADSVASDPDAAASDALSEC